MMNGQSIEKTVKLINNLVKQQLWLDFDVKSYNGFDLIIGGSIDLSNDSDLITVRFSNVDYFCLNSTWHSDTSEDVLRVVTEDELIKLRSKVTIHPDSIVFQFIPEDIISSLYISAKNISFEYDSNAIKAPKIRIV
jgi:hypothetical protein